MKNHKRIIPRDFFNESKLLKCLGRFELLVKFGSDGNCIFHTETEHDLEPFRIVQDDSDGSLSVDNYQVKVNNELVYLFIPYNSKNEYPLLIRYKGEDYYVFDSEGKVMPDFLSENPRRNYGK